MMLSLFPRSFAFPLSAEEKGQTVAYRREDDGLSIHCQGVYSVCIALHEGQSFPKEG